MWVIHKNEFLEISYISLKSQEDEFVSFLNKINVVLLKQCYLLHFNTSFSQSG